MLHTPDSLISEGVSQFYLLDPLVVHRLFRGALPVRVRLLPGLRLGLEFVQQVEFQDPPFFICETSVSRNLHRGRSPCNGRQPNSDEDPIKVSETAAALSRSC